MGPTGETGSVPVQGQNQSQENPFSAQLKAANDAVQAAAKKLQSTPVYASSGVPQPMMPVPGAMSSLFQNASPSNLNNVRPQTAAGERAKGIGQIAGSAANIVGKFMQRKEAQKTQALAQDVYRAMELYQGMEEAGQILQANPNDPAAKAQAQKNKAQLNVLLNGKNAKEIAKAFDITFGKEAQSTSQEDKNDSMHYKAAQDAMKQMKQDRATQFQDQMPQRLMLSPAYQQAYSEYQQAIKNATDAQKSLTPIAVAETNKEAKIGSAQISAQSAMDRIQAQLTERAQEAELHSQTEIKKQAMHDSTYLKGVAEHISMAKQVLENPQKLEIEKMRMGAGMYKTIGEAINKRNSDNTALLGDLNKAKKAKDPNTASNIQSQIDINNSVMKALQDAQNEFKLYATDDPDASNVMGLINGLGPI